MSRIYMSRTCWGTSNHVQSKCPATAEAPSPNTRPRPRTFSSCRPTAIHPDTRRTRIPLCWCTGANTQPCRPDTRPRRRKCAGRWLAVCLVCRDTNTCNRPRCWCTRLGMAHARCVTSIHQCLKHMSGKIYEYL